MEDIRVWSTAMVATLQFVRVWRPAWTSRELGGHGASGQTAPYARVNARHNGRPVATTS